jgi:hypothetical protein
MTDPVESTARAFFRSRQLVPTISSDGTFFWVDLMNATTGSVVAPRYGRGSSEDHALSSAVARYRLEQADWDQSGVEVALEFVPTITTPPHVREVVISAFVREGIQVTDFVRPPTELEAEQRHPDWKWASPSLRVHVVADLPVEEIVRKIGLPIGIALTSVRKDVGDLPFGVTVDRPDSRIWLSWKHDDGPDEIARAMEGLPQDLADRSVIGWDRERGVWLDLFDRR